MGENEVNDLLNISGGVFWYCFIGFVNGFVLVLEGLIALLLKSNDFLALFIFVPSPSVALSYRDDLGELNPTLNAVSGLVRL